MSSKISWTEDVWNPIVGCSIASPGCHSCYATRMANRLQAMGLEQYQGTVGKTSKGKVVWTGKVAMAPDSVLFKPLKRRKPTMYFVNSMGDLFHEDVPDEWIDLVVAVMALCPQHTFQILSKRSERMCHYVTSRNNLGNADICKAINDIPYPLGNRHGALQMPLPNVWLGVSAEDQRRADERIPHLLDTPAAVRFVSIEPQLEDIDLTHRQWPLMDDFYGKHTEERIDWIIQGCESGPGARPFNIQWARSMRDQCHAAGVPYFLKQSIDQNGKLDRSQILDGIKCDAMPGTSNCETPVIEENENA